MEPCLCHLKFFLHQLARLRIPSWSSFQLSWVDAFNFGSTAHAHKHFICMAGVEGEVPFLNPGFAKLLPPRTSSGPLLRTLLGWSWRGQGHSGWLRCDAANGLAQPGGTKPKKNIGHSPIGRAIPHLTLLSSSAHPFLWL